MVAGAVMTVAGVEAVVVVVVVVVVAVVAAAAMFEDAMTVLSAASEQAGSAVRA